MIGLSRIDVLPMRPGWGSVWQGSELSVIDDTVPAPNAIASLIGDVGIGPCVSCFVIDNDKETLPDDILLPMVDSVIAFLKYGRNVLIHCFEGKYRSTYLDVAVHMKILDMSSLSALELIQRQHPIADLRLGTKAQLLRLEKVLREGIESID